MAVLWKALIDENPKTTFVIVCLLGYEFLDSLVLWGKNPWISSLSQSHYSSFFFSWVITFPHVLITGNDKPHFRNKWNIAVLLINLHYSLCVHTHAHTNTRAHARWLGLLGTELLKYSLQQDFVPPWGGFHYFISVQADRGVNHVDSACLKYRMRTVCF